MSNEVVKIRACSFCNKDEYSVIYIFYSLKHNIDICNECISYLANMIKSSGTSIETYTPSELKRVISSKVYGQEESVKALSICLFKHMYNVKHVNANVKSNLLVVGSTGCGKTFMLEVAAKLLGIDILVVDCTSLTSTGYIGDDVESILGRLYKKCNSNIEAAEKSIVFLDEFDKLAAKESSVQKDIGGEAVQQELLKVIEGAQVDFLIDNKRIGMGRTISLNTSKMLFIAGGSFNGLEEKIKRATISKENTFFKPSSKNDREDREAVVLRNSLIDFGIIPELAGRFASVTIMKKLAKEDFIKILLSVDSTLKGYLDMLSKHNIVVNVHTEAIDLIADYAIDLSIGARGLNYIIDRVFSDILFLVGTYKSRTVIELDAEYAEKLINKQGEIRLL